MTSFNIILPWFEHRVEQARNLRGLIRIQLVFFIFFFGIEGYSSLNLLSTNAVSNESNHNCLVSDAEIFLDRHKWSDARDCYLDLIKKDVNLTTAWIGLATSLTYLGQRKEALRQLSVGVDQVKINQKSQVMKRIHILSRLFLTNATFQTYQDGLILFSAKKFKLALEKFERTLSEEPDNVEVLLRLGQSTLLDGNFQSAVNYFKQAHQLDSYDYEALLWLGKSLKLSGKLRDSLSELKNAYYGIRNSEGETGRELETATLWYSEVLADSGQVGAALRILGLDSKANPSHLRSLIASAKLRMQVSKPDAGGLSLARKELTSALKRLELTQSNDSISSSVLPDEWEMLQNETPDEIKLKILGFLKQIEHVRTSIKHS
jgi:tetratricopeptide (TPR) repeat protein